ncbi:MAG: glycosyltransferase, partial [Spirochaetia bacterium]|nr:glycosyltransferase [Spirochaetia bacterium]
YKRVDLAIEAFNDLDLPLWVAGEGSEFLRLKSKAGANIRFLGRVGEAERIRLYAECRAFVFPGKEDFGIAPLEANASGKPVIAFAAGGAMETLNARTAVFFQEPTAASLKQAVLQLEKTIPKMNPKFMIQNARRFSEKVFLNKMKSFFGSLECK